MTAERLTSADIASLPKAEFAFPGPLRDRLVAAILDGTKTATTGLLVEYEVDSAPLPKIGQRSVVIDSGDQPVALIETTGVRVVVMAEADVAHAVDEGEGYATVAQWRAAHEQFWHSEQMRSILGDATFTVNDTTMVVLERFRLVAGLRAGR
jgi:uncharacterized protein YhfF